MLTIGMIEVIQATVMVACPNHGLCILRLLLYYRICLKLAIQPPPLLFIADAGPDLYENTYTYASTNVFTYIHMPLSNAFLFKYHMYIHIFKYLYRCVYTHVLLKYIYIYIHKHLTFMLHANTMDTCTTGWIYNGTLFAMLRMPKAPSSSLSSNTFLCISCLLLYKYSSNTNQPDPFGTCYLMLLVVLCPAVGLTFPPSHHRCAPGSCLDGVQNSALPGARINRGAVPCGDGSWHDQLVEWHSQEEDAWRVVYSEYLKNSGENSGNQM